MPDHVRTFLAALEHNGLCDRYPELAPYQMLAEMGQLSQSAAAQLLFQLQGVIDELEDFPNELHRPPTQDQLYADGKPDIEVGTLIEGDELRFGIRLRGRVPHILAAGAAGSGKTTLLRVMIIAIEKMNEDAN